MNSCTTIDRHGYSVKFSPFHPNQLLLASSQLYGLAGGGTLFLLQLHNTENAADDDIDAASGDSDIGVSRTLEVVCRMEWTDGLFDVACCPYAENVAASASGDGSLQIWGDIANNAHETIKGTSKPSMCLQEHKNEVYSIDWGEQWNQNFLLSASWDGTIKLWDCNRRNSVATFADHTDFVYGAKFSPLIANLFASPLMSIKAAAPQVELLSLDWSQFDRNILVTGGSDGLVHGWDLRMLKTYTFELYSGECAVRRLAFSPTNPSVLASANYDFTTRIWNLSQSMEAVGVDEYHSEFVCGLDWNPNAPYQLADCGWDAVVNVYTPKSLQNLSI